MNKRYSTLILVATLVLILVGGGVLYNYLSGLSDSPNLVVDRTTEQQVTETQAHQTTQTTQGTQRVTESVAPTSPAQRKEPSAPDSERVMAPEFQITDADGETVTLSNQLGKPVILNFWASWCPPCKEEMPDFEDAYAEHGDDIQFMMINLTDGDRETRATADAYLDEFGFTFPVFYDLDSSAAISYGLRSVPTTYFISAEGEIIAHAFGMIDRATLEQGIGLIS